MLLKIMVGASGFEPPASWSRTRRSSQAEPRPESNFAADNSLRGIACDGNGCLAIERERTVLAQVMACHMIHETRQGRTHIRPLVPPHLTDWYEGIGSQLTRANRNMPARPIAASVSMAYGPHLFLCARNGPKAKLIGSRAGTSIRHLCGAKKLGMISMIDGRVTLDEKGHEFERQ
jgi:hypothetical protein